MTLRRILTLGFKATAGLLLVASVAASQGAADRTTAERLVKEAEQLRSAGNAESQRQALEKFEESIPLWRTVGDRAQEATSLFQIGAIQRALGDNRRALDYVERALALRRTLGDGARLVEALSLAGALHSALGDNSKALDAYAEAVAVARTAGDRQGEGRTENRIGLLYASVGDYQKALDAFTRAVPLVQAAGDRAGEAATWISIGQTQQLTGQNQNALESFRQALTRFRALGNRAGEATAVQNLGVIYGTLGDQQESLRFFGDALAIYRTLGNRAQEALTLNNTGGIYIALGEHRKAREFYNQALPLARASGDPVLEARTLHNLAEAAHLLDEKQAALDYARQALSRFQAAGDRRGEATVQVQIGSIHYSTGEREPASEAYGEALRISRTLKDAAGEALALTRLARIDRDTGNLVGARDRMEAALSSFESIRSGVAIQELRASYLASTRKEYEFLTDLQMELHKLRPSEGFDALAFQTSERARARSLLELLEEGHAEIRHDVDAVLLDRERSLQQRLNVVADRYMRLPQGRDPGDRAAAATRDELASLTAELQETEAQIRLKSPRYAALTQPRPLSLKEVQEQVVDSDTLLLEYALGEERSYLWAVTKTSLITRELPPRANIEAAARRVYGLLTARQPRADRPSLTGTALAETDARFAAEAAALSQMLLGPVTANLGAKRLLIVSDGALQYLPFAALPSPYGKTPFARPLIEENEVVHMPSASALALLRRDVAGRPPAPKSMAVLADPVFTADDERVRRAATDKATVLDDSTRKPGVEQAARDTGLSIARLLFSRREAAEISGVANSGEVMKALDFDASRETATSPALSQYRVVHFATHGILNNEHAELSGIVLSLVDRRGLPQDGFLRLHDLYNLSLPAELVVLSACQTALGKEISGEGLVGLTRGFMYAGAARVLSSLWKVDDAATAELMRRFYDGMLGSQRLSPVAALRAAQISLARQRQWASPYYWGAFILQGEWQGWEQPRRNR